MELIFLGIYWLSRLLIFTNLLFLKKTKEVKFNID